MWTGAHALGQTDRSYADGFVGLGVGVLLGRFGNKMKLGLIQHFPCQHAADAKPTAVERFLTIKFETLLGTCNEELFLKICKALGQ